MREPVVLRVRIGRCKRDCLARPRHGVPSVTVAKAGNGDVNSADKFISCGSKCSASYNLDATVTLTASPAPGLKFTGRGGACCGTSQTCAVAINKDTQVQAIFK
jgi:hypothetical protein